MIDIDDLPVRVRCIRGDEIDVVADRRFLKWRTGETSGIKIRMRRRDRRYAGQAIRYALR